MKKAGARLVAEWATDEGKYRQGVRHLRLLLP